MQAFSQFSGHDYTILINEYLGNFDALNENILLYTKLT